MQALITDRVRMGLGLAYTDAHYTQTVRFGDEVIVREGDAVGTRSQTSSPWNVTASIDYRWPVRQDVALEFRAEDVFRSRNPGPFREDDPASPSSSPAQRADPSVNLLNLRASANWQNFDVSLFVNNAPNAQPTLLRDDDGSGGAIVYATTLRPRTVGLTCTWHF